jgi:hypothetical protein
VTVDVRCPLCDQVMVRDLDPTALYDFGEVMKALDHVGQHYYGHGRPEPEEEAE